MRSHDDNDSGDAGVALTEARAIARDAYVYGFPLVDNYRIMYEYWVDRDAAEYKGSINTIQNSANVYGPQDRAVQTPNSDTPYSCAWLDLRAEPVVLTLPTIPHDRYYSVQLIDMYTHNFEYLGTRTTASEGGTFAVVGPAWNGELPKGLSKVLRADTEFVFALYRTQLFEPRDIDDVRKVQAGYRVQPLSDFLGESSPKSAPPVVFIKPLPVEAAKTSVDFFTVLNFVLTLCPTLEGERTLMKRFAKIGIGAGKRFASGKLSPELRKAVEDGMADAWKLLSGLQKDVDSGKVTSGDLFGTRQFLHENYLYRMGGAVLGIYGNSRQEAIYPVYFVDSNGAPLDGAHRDYVLRFADGQLPPVDAFWSLTMYNLPERLLVANACNRYLVNSAMLPGLKRDSDGGITLYLQNQSPGKEKESNWLPAPDGPFFAVLRLYMPKPAALDGTWKHPPLRATD